MIIRILGEGQFEVDEEAADRLEELDAKLLAAIEANDSAAFDPALDAILDATRRLGSPLPADRFSPSDMALPHAGTTLDELKDLLEEPEESPDRDEALLRPEA
ncbi:MAG: hypothetical protein M0008_07100 [Actinomycetota bacterium]|nr:hypothetical protein [Actinomycetota bacterium]